MNKTIAIIIFCIVGVIITICSIMYIDKPQKSEEEQKLEYCWGVYHATKPDIEVNRHEIWVLGSHKYNSIHDTPIYKKGLEVGLRLTPEQKTECYDLIYPVLAEAQIDKGRLTYSKPYCFGYLKVARGQDYVPLFCEKRCQKINVDDCVNWCSDDLHQNLKKSRVLQGEGDARIVNPAQFVQCIEETNSMM